MHSWTSAHLRPKTAQDVITPCSSHLCLTDPNLLYGGKPSEVVPSFPFGSGAAWLLRRSGPGTDVHFSGDETGLQWEDCLFELQNAVKWRMVISRGQDERSQMHAMSPLLNTYSGMTNRGLIDEEQDGYSKEMSKNARAEQLV